MNIQTAKTQTDFENINQLFGTIWKEEFELDRFDRIDDYKKGIVFFIQQNNEIISAIYFYESENNWKIGRFGTKKSERKKGRGKQLN